MRDFRIHQIIINEIGAFKNLNLTLKEQKKPGKAEIHILTGENGTGKSTILQAIAAVHKPTILTSKVHLDENEKRYFDIRFSSIVKRPEITQEDITSFEFENYSFSNGQWKKNFGVKDNSVLKDYFNKWEHYKYQKFDFAIFAYSGYRRLDQGNVQYIREIDESPLKNSLDISNSINPQVLLQWIANTKTKEAIAFTKGDSQKAQSLNESIGRIQNIVSEITGWKIEFDLADNPLRVEIKVDGINLDFDMLPDGLKSIISWVADLLMRMERLSWTTDISIFDRNFILLLDEIEVHLHPAWQRKVLPIIQGLFKNAQLIVSTHSPFVTNSVDDAWIYKFKKIDHYSILDGEPILSENGKSYRTVLEEVFDVTQQFGEEIENDLKKFYLFKDEIIKGDRDINDKDFQKLFTDLSVQSIELENIIGLELKQIRKLSNNRTEINETI